MRLLQLCEKTINDVSKSKIDRVHIVITGDIADAVTCYALTQSGIDVIGHVIPLSDRLQEQEAATDIQTALSDGGEWILPEVALRSIYESLDLLNPNGDIEDKSIENLVRIHKIGKRISYSILEGLAKNEAIACSIDKTRRILGLGIPEDELIYSPLRSISRSVVYQIAAELANTLPISLSLAQYLFKRMLTRPSYEDTLLINSIFTQNQLGNLSHLELLNSTDYYISQALEGAGKNNKVDLLVKARKELINWRSA